MVFVSTMLGSASFLQHLLGFVVRVVVGRCLLLLLLPLPLLLLCLSSSFVVAVVALGTLVTLVTVVTAVCCCVTVFSLPLSGMIISYGQKLLGTISARQYSSRNQQHDEEKTLPQQGTRTRGGRHRTIRSRDDGCSWLHAICPLVLLPVHTHEWGVLPRIPIWFRPRRSSSPDLHPQTSQQLLSEAFATSSEQGLCVGGSSMFGTTGGGRNLELIRRRSSSCSISPHETIHKVQFSQCPITIWALFLGRGFAKARRSRYCPCR